MRQRRRPTLKENRFGRADGIDENLALLLSSSLVPERNGGLSLAIPMIGEREVVAIFICENFPHEWDVLGLAKKHHPDLVNFLYAGHAGPRLKRSSVDVRH